MKYVQSSTFSTFHCHCSLFRAPFRWSCCVKMVQKYKKSTFLACFDLIMSESFFGLEDSRRPMYSRLSVRPYGFSEKSAYQICLIFLMKLWLQNCKKVTVSLFGRKFKIGPFWPKMVRRKFKIGPFLAKNNPNLAIFDQKTQCFQVLI